MAAARGGLAPHARATEEGARPEGERGRCEREGAGGRGSLLQNSDRRVLSPSALLSRFSPRRRPTVREVLGDKTALVTEEMVSAQV